MRNCLWVCFACQGAVRRSATAKDVRCSACGLACECLGTKIAIPAKSKPKEWESLRQAFYLARGKRLAARDQRRVQRIHQLEQEIVRLQAMPENPGRARAVAELQKKLAQERA